MLKACLRYILQTAQEEPRLHATFNRTVAAGRYLEGREGLLIDIGARDGVYTAQLLESVTASNRTTPFGDWRPVLVEISQEYLARARQRFGCVRANVERSGLPFESRSASCVVINQVLEHLKDPFQVLAECDRVLKVGGIFLIGVPNLAGLVNRLYLLAGKQPAAINLPGPHVRGYTLRSLRAYLKTNPNFVLRRVFGSCLYPLPPFLSEPLAVRWPGLACYMFFVLEKVADAQPSAWEAGRHATGETTFGDG